MGRWTLPRVRPRVADEVMIEAAVSAQLTSLADKVSDIRTDVAVIKVQTAPIQDHENRIRSLEASRSKIWGWWTAAAVMGAAIGWVLSALVRVR